VIPNLYSRKIAIGEFHGTNDLERAETFERDKASIKRIVTMTINPVLYGDNGFAL